PPVPAAGSARRGSATPHTVHRLRRTDIAGATPRLKITVREAPTAESAVPASETWIMRGRAGRAGPGVARSRDLGSAAPYCPAPSCPALYGPAPGGPAPSCPVAEQPTGPHRSCPRAPPRPPLLKITVRETATAMSAVPASETWIKRGHLAARGRER